MPTAQTRLVLNWTPEYSVHVGEIDHEHQKFFQLSKNLYSAISARSSRAVIGALLGELYAYSAHHMTHEEEILERFDYPELQAHRDEHKKFREKIRDFMDEFDAGRDAIALSLLQFVQEWLHSHMENVDRRYADFLRSRGVQ